MIEPSKHIVRALADYLDDEMEDTLAAEVIENFPQPSEALELPCVSIFLGQPQFTSKMPELVSQAATADPNVKTSLYAVGSYDYRLQVDIWTGSKEERHAVFSELFGAINKQVKPMGLALTLTDYHNEVCRFDIVGHRFMDAEPESQRQEWRVQVDILAHGRVLMEKDEPIMSTIENNFSTPNNIPE